MKSPRKLGTLLLWLLVAVVMTITFRMASPRTPVNHKPLHDARYLSRVEPQPSAQLVETALRKTDFGQSLNGTEEAALHMPLRMPNNMTLLPDHSLLVEAIPVVEDPSLTWDPCLALNGGNGGTQTGAWTFNELMLAVADTNDGNPQPAEELWTNMMVDLVQNQTIGNFTAQARQEARNFFDYWPKDPFTTCINPISVPPNSCLSLKNSPVHLNAIVNRLDSGQNGSSDRGGMLLFVFGVTMNPTNNGGNGEGSGGFCENQQGGSGSGNQDFNIILEYTVPSTNYITGQSITAQSWAQMWQSLSNVCPNGFTNGCAQGLQQGQFDYYLNNIVQLVVAATAGGSNAPNKSALADIRTNEVELAGPGTAQHPPVWEMREWAFAASSGNGVGLIEVPLTQTPDLSYDGAGVNGTMFCTFSNQDPNNMPPGCSNQLGTIEGLILTEQSFIEGGTFSVPTSEQAVSALNPPGTTQSPGLFWDSSPSMQSNSNLYTPRVIFAATSQVYNPVSQGPDRLGGINGTCNGCHGSETQTAFQQVANRAATGSGDQPSALSAFLVGCNNGGGVLTGTCQTPFNLSMDMWGNEVVQDPVYSSYQNTFGDIGRRFNCMTKILNNSGSISCNGAGN